MREIVLDTETTGLNPFTGDRLIEIGAIELHNKIMTQKKFHVYINPQTQISEGAYRVHGISNDMLKDKPLFDDIAADFLDFIAGATLVIHNAQFDLKFLNYQLSLLNLPSIDSSNVVDTLAMARNLFPRTKVNLDALCKKFKIDNSDRTFHGALKDSMLLAEVYANLCGGNQFTFGFEQKVEVEVQLSQSIDVSYRNDKVVPPSEEELIAHNALLLDIAQK
jgi:DNA polymerase-3 subunit epsilon